MKHLHTIRVNSIAGDSIYRIYNEDGQMHHPTEPARVGYRNGRIFEVSYFNSGQFHRIDKPAYVYYYHHHHTLTTHVQWRYQGQFIAECYTDQDKIKSARRDPAQPIHLYPNLPKSV